MDIQRNIDLNTLLKKKSVLLLGPRSTGKSFYVRKQLQNIHNIDLLHSQNFLTLSSNPSALEDIVNLHAKYIIAIDEIQKIPALLDEVHRLIETKDARFLMTGSSARKLRKEGVNLLAGRAWLARMFPLNSSEILQIQNELPLKKILTYGTLPQVWLSQDPDEEMDSYVQTYIEMEIKAEGIIRKIPAFSRFLKIASLSSGELINFQNISSDAEVPVSTVKEHYKILEDTMIGYLLEPWLESKKRKAISTAKFYFFDNGVLNHLSGLKPEVRDSPIWGNRFEQFIVNEVQCANWYQRRKNTVNFWRSTSQYEVDLLFGTTAIEIKSAKKVKNKMMAGLQALREESKHKTFILVSDDPIEKKTDGIYQMNYKNFLNKLWQGEF